jgi:anti-anti-sigma factor
MRATARVLDRFRVVPIAGGWKVGGEVDADTAPALAEALVMHRPDITGEYVIVDLWDVDFMDSSGLFTLLDARARLIGDGRMLILRRPSRCIVRLLDITQLRQTFQVEQSRNLSGGHEHRRRPISNRLRPSHR